MLHHPLFPNGNIYLSGGMEHAENLGAGWRSSLSKELKQLKYFPLDICELDRAYHSQYGELYRSVDESDLLQRKSNIRKHFVYTDLELIKNDSDALIVYYDESVRRGAGTISECQVAFNLDIPIFLVSAYPNMNKDVPGWLMSLTSKAFTNFEQLVNYLSTLPSGILKRDVYGNRHSGDLYLCSLCGIPFEKHKHHFVSKVTPLYCSSCVDLVKTTYESHKDRYLFFKEYLDTQVNNELKETITDKESNVITSLLSAMEMQECREKEELHISQPNAKAAWDEAIAEAQAFLSKKSKS